MTCYLVYILNSDPFQNFACSLSHSFIKTVKKSAKLETSPLSKPITRLLRNSEAIFQMADYETTLRTAYYELLNRLLKIC